MTSKTFTEHVDAVADAVERGVTVANAAREAGVGTRTVERWINKGRENPGGPYGPFASRVDAARVEREAIEPADGPVSEALGAYVATLGELGPDLELRAALARSLARAIDGAGTSGAALAALPRLTAQLEETLLGLVSPDDDAAAIAARMLAPFRPGGGDG